MIVWEKVRLWIIQTLSEEENRNHWRSVDVDVPVNSQYRSQITYRKILELQ